ncbi:MAG: Bax inhibitor-1/YccA family protein [bacterium]|nr:Bax inhibitor-1/YccA family protein [bacterium]
MANPILNENTFVSEEYSQYGMTNVMTKEGVITKTTGLLLLTVVASAMAWFKAISAPEAMMPIFMVGIIGGFITAMIISFKRNLAQYLAPVYAILEGLAIGGISCLMEAQFPGIVYQAVLGTFAVFFTVLALYASRIIVVTEKVRGVIFSATLAVMLVYLVSFILSFFGIRVPFINDVSVVGILISVIITFIAASNFLLDFDFIERGINNYAPKQFEWYASFGLMVTLIWVYIEVLKLLAKFSRRR